jgi:uncharacterized membrane protein
MYRTKQDFMEALEKELGRLGITDKSEIIADFELHFADSAAQGLSEVDICAKLGSISEIAKQYAEDEIYPVIAVEPIEPNAAHSVPQDEEPSSHKQTYTDYENSGIKFNFPKSDNINGGGLLAVICVDIFILSWAIPALFGIMVAFLAVPFALVVSGIVTMVGGAFGTGFFGFFSPFPGLVTFFAGLLLLSLGGLFALVGAAFIKLFIKVIRAVIDWHGNMIFGRPVFKKQEVSA